MSKRPVKFTGFTRFFIVMLFVAPLAYFGASWYNGEDGIQKFKNLLGIEQKKQADPADEPLPTPPPGDIITVNQSPSSSSKMEAENKRLKEELEFKSKRVDELYRENEALKRKLESLESLLSEKKN